MMKPVLRSDSNVDMATQRVIMKPLLQHQKATRPADHHGPSPEMRLKALTDCTNWFIVVNIVSQDALGDVCNERGKCTKRPKMTGATSRHGTVSRPFDPPLGSFWP